MHDNFWSTCTEAFLAKRRGDCDIAVELVIGAESLLTLQLPSGVSANGRRAFLEKLKSHIHGVKTIPGIMQAASESFSSDEFREKGSTKQLIEKIRQLEEEKNYLRKRLCTMPAIDPISITEPTYLWPDVKKEDFGIILFGHTRIDSLDAILESLRRQDALKYTEVWLDGHQGNPKLREKIKGTIEVVSRYPVKCLQTQSGNFGFRKMLILGLIEMCRKYEDILVLEDDCFPTRNAIAEFREELDSVRDRESIFSVYGHHFLVENEKPTCARFQGWGWATTAKKLTPILRQLVDCYSMTEERYLEFVRLAFTQEIRDRIDVTPPRLPSHTLEKFFAWDETLCLLTALNDLVHRPTEKRTIYNCGMGLESTHFGSSDIFRKPSFNLITADEVWQYF